MYPCQSCAENIEDAGRFCPYCGAEQAPGLDQSFGGLPTQEMKSRPPAPAGLDATMLISPEDKPSMEPDLLEADTVTDSVELGAAGRASVDMQANFTDGPSGVHAGEYSVGDVVEHYRIESVLGRGGMGQVFRAVHEITGQQAALKMLHREKIDDVGQRERFVNEARVLARLDHPNLVPLLGYIEEDNGVFIVLPFIDGETLEDLMAREGRLELPAALVIFEQLCAGLTWVHGEGILHRDLKPANVLIAEDGEVKLTDFGIARHMGAKAMTAAGMVVGTAEYLPPERAAGTARDDPRSDLYGLAVMLYEMLAGRPPFRDANAAKVMLKHLNNEPPPPRSINPKIPQAVEVEILKALAKAPAERHADIVEFREAIQRAAIVADADPQELSTVPISTANLDAHPNPYSPSSQVQVAPATTSSARAWWILAGVLLVLIAAGAAGAYWHVYGGQ